MAGNQIRMKPEMEVTGMCSVSPLFGYGKMSLETSNVPTFPIFQNTLFGYIGTQWSVLRQKTTDWHTFDVRKEHKQVC
jgi:hypothetical protein